MTPTSILTRMPATTLLAVSGLGFAASAASTDAGIAMTLFYALAVPFHLVGLVASVLAARIGVVPPLVVAFGLAFVVDLALAALRVAVPCLGVRRLGVPLHGAVLRFGVPPDSRG